jgi:periplasmic copper chaperone A
MVGAGAERQHTMTYKRQMFRMIIAGIFLTLPLLVGCASLEREAQALPDASERTLTIQDVWARSESPGQNSAAYLQISNSGDDADSLTGAESGVAESTEIHEVISHDNVMQMQEVDQVEIPAGETINLEPGGHHVMLFGLTDDLEVGDEIELTLVFEQAGAISVTAEVRDHVPSHGHSYRAPGQGGL